MTVYIINNMTIHDRAQYDEYVAKFPPVWRKFNGTILSIQDAPAPLEGAWPFDRTVLLSFPSRADAKAWIESPEYRAIAQHRYDGTHSNVVMLDAFAGKIP